MTHIHTVIVVVVVDGVVVNVVDVIVFMVSLLLLQSFAHIIYQLDLRFTPAETNTLHITKNERPSSFFPPEADPFPSLSVLPRYFYFSKETNILSFKLLKKGHFVLLLLSKAICERQREILHRKQEEIALSL